MQLADALAKMQARADGQGEWLKENCPYVVADQKHLDANTPERAYWHFGYRAALLDVIKLIQSCPEASEAADEIEQLREAIRIMVDMTTDDQTPWIDVATFGLNILKKYAV